MVCLTSACGTQVGLIILLLRGIPAFAPWLNTLVPPWPALIAGETVQWHRLRLLVGLFMGEGVLLRRQQGLFTGRDGSGRSLCFNDCRFFNAAPGRDLVVRVVWVLRAHAHTMRLSGRRVVLGAEGLLRQATLNHGYAL